MARWFLFPSDSRRREREYPFYLLAHNLAAVACLFLWKGGPVSSAEMNEFMIQRAKEYPICLLVLLELRAGILALMMHNLECIGKRGCVQLFLSALKVACLLSCLTLI